MTSIANRGARLVAPLRGRLAGRAVATYNEETNFSGGR